MLTVMVQASDPEQDLAAQGNSVSAGEATDIATTDLDSGVAADSGDNADSASGRVGGSGSDVVVAEGSAVGASVLSAAGGVSRRRLRESVPRDVVVGQPRRFVAALSAAVGDNVPATVLGGLLVLALGFSLQVLNDRIGDNHDVIISLDEKVDTKFEKLGSEIDTKFEKLGSEIDTKFEKLESEIDAKFEKLESEIDAKFEKVDAKFEKIDAKFEQLEGDIDYISRNLLLLIALLGKTEEIESVIAVADPDE